MATKDLLVPWGHVEPPDHPAQWDHRVLVDLEADLEQRAPWVSPVLLEPLVLLATTAVQAFRDPPESLVHVDQLVPVVKLDLRDLMELMERWDPLDTQELTAVRALSDPKALKVPEDHLERLVRMVFLEGLESLGLLVNKVLEVLLVHRASVVALARAAPWAPRETVETKVQPVRWVARARWVSLVPEESRVQLVLKVPRDQWVQMAHKDPADPAEKLVSPEMTERRENQAKTLKTDHLDLADVQDPLESVASKVNRDWLVFQEKVEPRAILVLWARWVLWALLVFRATRERMGLQVHVVTRVTVAAKAPVDDLVSMVSPDLGVPLESLAHQAFYEY